MTFEQSVEVSASPADLFALTQDYGRRLEWDPFLRSAELVGGAAAPAVGVRAYCVAHSGLGMETEYVSYTPPRVAAVRMTRGPWLIRSFAGSWRFTEVAPGRTRVGFRYGLTARPRWLSWLLTPVLARVFARDTRKRLAALKAAVESGRLAEPRTRTEVSDARKGEVFARD
jgi:ribosome-associated toxin RatA of RatAB toxin-antitoxin module